MQKHGKSKTRPAGSVQDFLLAKLASHPEDIVNFTAKHFGISKVAVQKHLRTLAKAGRVEKSGQTRNTRWSIIIGEKLERKFNLRHGLSESDIWAKEFAPRILDKVPENVLDIIRYGFTEMVNNAIDHSDGQKLEINLEIVQNLVSIAIRDDGIGIFEKIQKKFNLLNSRESILELSKGKVTTDPDRHSGEGIFFTSRAFDRFEIRSRELIFIKDNLQDDWLIDSNQAEKNEGTEVRLEIRKNAFTQLPSIFGQFTNPDTFRFDHTYIVVELAKYNETDYVSRSQAKRILVGLEKFSRVVLDFRNVKTVGQAFVDEVFRVFKTQHPDVNFEVLNANENVDFMVKRGIATISLPD